MIFDIIYMLKKEGLNPEYAQIINKLIDGVNCDFTTLFNFDKEKKIKLPFLPKKMNYSNISGISYAKSYVLYGKKNDNTIANFNFLRNAHLTNAKDIVNNITGKECCLGYEGLITSLERKNTQKLFYFNYTPANIYASYNSVKGIRGYIFDNGTDKNGKCIRNGVYTINIVVVQGVVKTAIINKYSANALIYFNAVNHCVTTEDPFELKYTNKKFKQLNILPEQQYDINFDDIQHYIEQIFNALHTNGIESIIEPSINKTTPQKLSFTIKA